MLATPAFVRPVAPHTAAATGATITAIREVTHVFDSMDFFVQEHRDYKKT